MKSNVKIILPNSFFEYHGVNPDSRDGYYCDIILDGEIVFASIMEEEVDINGDKRFSYEG